MASKRILGLDLGTNSIGWAIINEQDGNVSISGAGSRIIPMDAKQMGDFESGNTVSQTADRTRARIVRRMYQRHGLRRERLNRVLNILGYLPDHYAVSLDSYGKIKKGKEPKIEWTPSGDFLFKQSFQEMLDDFAAVHPELSAENKKIPHDWTIYYLRKKALSKPLSGQELAWVLHQFNSKRGYNQSRSEQEEANPTEKKELISLRVLSVKDTGEVSKGKTWYEISLDNGWTYKRQSAYPLDWEGKTRDFIVTTKLNEDGTEKLDKDGQVKRSLSAPSEDDWGLRKIKTEHDISESKKTVGSFIYDALLYNPDQKIIGKLVRTVDRKFYRSELIQILKKQLEFLPELSDRNLYTEAIYALYQQNESYRKSITNRDFIYLLADDVLFYQRPLKSKKTLIGECPYEYHAYKDKEGVEHRLHLKCISKSHPLYEEFRVWQFVNNLHIYYSEDGYRQIDVTDEKVHRAELAEWLLTQKEIDQKELLRHITGKSVKGLTWNYVADKIYPMSPTHALIYKAIGDQMPITSEVLEHLWHILYSVSDKLQLEQAIMHYAEAHDLNKTFVDMLKRQKPFASDYGAYSEKAVRKLLALMRYGNSWNVDNIDSDTYVRINNILTGELDSTIDNRLREKCSALTSINDFQGLQTWFAEYVVYGIRKNNEKWGKPEDIDNYLHSFRLHSLNNPVVEQIVMESLRVVRDIWRRYGQIDEIHLEMGREMKLPADKRRQILLRQTANEKANADAFNQVLQYVPNPSARDIRKYRLWEEQGKRSPYTGQPIDISQLFSSSYEIEHVIPQSRYFDDSMTNKVVCEAEVNHLKDRQMGHEFISRHGGEKVTLSGGRVVEIFSLEVYEDFVKSTFRGNRAKIEKMMLDDIPENFIARQLNDSRYISNMMKGLLSNIVRERNPITGEYESEATSKNLIVCTGAVTDRLKKDWGINDVWNHIILPRFERMNEILGSTEYTEVMPNGRIIPTVPQSQRSGFNKKRIDHRHHAMDAIVIACTTRSHVALLSNENASSSKQEQRFDLSRKLRQTSVVEWAGRKHTVFGDFKKPWETYTQDVENVLREIIVSFKQNLRVVNKSNNHTLKIVDGKKKHFRQESLNWAIRKPLHKDTVFGLVNLKMTKTVNLKTAMMQIERIVEPDLRKKIRQMVNDGRDEKSIRKYFEMDKDVWSDINLNKIVVYYYTNETEDRYYATRVTIDESFDYKMIREKVTDNGIQKILLAHLTQNGGDPLLAFSQDGLERMNCNIQLLNNGVSHKPIYKVRKYEKADKFAIGRSGAKAKKYVEAAKGTSLYTMVYECVKNEERETSRLLVPLSLRDIISAQISYGLKWKDELDLSLREMCVVPNDYEYKFILSPGMLVYVPTDEEIESGNVTYDRTRLYKTVSLDGENPNFIPASIASVITDGVEFTRHNKTSRSLDGRLIKKICIPIEVDRLGNIISNNI